jgi:lysophospholipase L1-like esterase
MVVKLRVERMERKIMSRVSHAAWSLFLIAGIHWSAVGQNSDAIASRETHVVCFGDSITAGKYPTILAERLPTLTVTNAGKGGNTTGAGLKRMAAEVLAKNPEVVIIMFGTNDSVLTAPGRYRTPLPAFKKNLETMVARCRAAGAIPVLATLLPIIEAPYYTRHPKEFYEPDGGLGAIVERYREGTIETAKKLGVVVVDMNRLISRDETHLKPDGVHPSVAGEKAIARHVELSLRNVLNLSQDIESTGEAKPGDGLD